ncbi:NADP-dependent malic enzyme [Myxococcota bacterium]|nr:NADP-dependent malic enzyme [Myxococcota bacterium]MBU1432544.1 NADP-dependent malic enzyme [Myxococcota bacterium]MBU1898833.1 NADP-dependent malic enzyme [Myxococcota bacterium]
MAHYRKLALAYHLEGRPGKLKVTPTKPCVTQRDLSLAYTPGVAEPCLDIAANVEDVFKYTNKGNLVAVVSNGTAVLGLGDIGPEAGKPVMEGKGVLFSRFADIDVFDIEIDSKDIDEIVRFCEMLAPTVGGINLEDIAAPDCFDIEARLIESLDIPVFHDDQHGTAIISGAGLINALDIVGKAIDQVKIVFNGAGAAGLACCQHFMNLGVKRENLLLCDSRGVIYQGRSGINRYKAPFAVETEARTLADAMRGADVFCGVSVKDVVTPEMVASMAADPIIFAMANPDPEITYEAATAVRGDLIMATGRSDYPNQVNNVLGFPFIFRGALDVRASKITTRMKIAATHALADLAREDVPEVVSRAYQGRQLHFGREYIIPTPFDPRALVWVSIAVARAAVEDGVARQPITDWEAYRAHLETKLDPTRWLVSTTLRELQREAQIPRIVFPDGDSTRVIRACSELARDGVCKPVILGEPELIKAMADKLEVDVGGCELLNPYTMDTERYAQALFEQRQRKGMTLQGARVELRSPNTLGAALVQWDGADGMVSGALHHYSWTVRPALEIVGLREGVSTCCGVHVMLWDQRTVLFVDTAINPSPTAEMLADFAVMGAELARTLHLDPKIAFLSISNFGSYKAGATSRIQQALKLAQARLPDVPIDGEMQADTAVSPEISAEWFPFSKIQGDANVLIFPTLCAGNIAYKLCRELGGARSIGPILMGLAKPINILHRTASVEEIVDITAITARRWQLQRA